MMDSAEQLSGLERCPRIPFWDKDWKFGKLKPVEMIEAGVRAGLMEHTRTDFGELAGEEVYGFGTDPGIDSKQYDQHGEVVHLACIADIVTCAIRRPGSDPWKLAPPFLKCKSGSMWEPGCYVSPKGDRLRRIAFVTSWNDDRHYSHCRSWESLGEICFHNLPMQMVVVKLGQHREGKFYSYWSHGLLHPSGNRMPRFRRRKDIEEGFKGSWIECWREDRSDITTENWLQGMLDDGVLNDLCVRVDIPVPKEEARQRIIDLALQKLATVHGTTELPLQNLPTCDWPTPCRHRDHCHAQEEPSEAYGFVRLVPRSAASGSLVG